MKLWQIAALLFGVGIVYVLVKRPSVAGLTGPTTSNSTYGVTLNSLLNLGSSIINKIPAPSTVPPYSNQGTYDLNPSTVVGNTLVDDTTGKYLTYGTD